MRAMRKLREVENDYGTCLARVQDFDDDHAERILKQQAESGIKSWEPVPDETEVTDEVGNSVEEKAADSVPTEKKNKK